MMKLKYLCVSFLWIVSVWPVYAQHKQAEPAAQDTVGNILREQQMQARLESYVQMMSARKGNTTKGGRVNVWVMPVVGYHPSQLSYGLMVGVMKRTGGYLKAKHSFSKTSPTSFDCNDRGLSEPEGTERWYTGKTEKSRMALTGGIVQRIWKPLYLYAGAGYGSRTQVWETISGSWAKNKDHSFEGVEAEIGAIVAFRHLVVSIGAQTNSFELLEGNLGIGVIF